MVTMSRTPDKASLNSFMATKSSPDSSSSNSSRKQVRRDACKSAPVRMTPQFFVFGSPAPRCSRRITLPSPSSVIASDNETEQAEVRVAWEDPSCGSMQMKDLLINHSATSVAMKLQNCAPKAPTPGRHVSARVSRPSFMKVAATQSRAAAPRSAPLPKYQANKKQPSAVPRESSSSSCSLSASSAGDIAATDRPPGPSPPSSLSTVSPACSLPSSSSATSSQSTADDLVQRYSFPVPPLELCEALETAGDFTRETPCSTQHSAISPTNNEANDENRLQDQTSNVSLVDIQEKVIELVDAQRACSQLTWCAMQHLSAALERLCPNVEPSVSEQRAAIAPPLLLEAAGCARRLAHILIQLGETPVQTVPSTPAVSAPAAAVRPSASDLQQQRARLRHVKSKVTSSPAADTVTEALRNVVARRRLSMETISSRTSTSSRATSCWDT